MGDLAHWTGVNGHFYYDPVDSEVQGWSLINSSKETNPPRVRKALLTSEARQKKYYRMGTPYSKCKLNKMKHRIGAVMKG